MTPQEAINIVEKVKGGNYKSAMHDVIQLSNEADTMAALQVCAMLAVAYELDYIGANLPMVGKGY